MSEKIYPNITAVDEHDEVIGYYQLPEALLLFLIRRISGVLLFNEHGQILLQRRSMTVLSPNCLDFSAAGHVNEGHDYLASAESELFEELGLGDVLLNSVCAPFMIPGYYIGLYSVTVPSATSFTLSADEVSEVLWVSIEELDKMVKINPHEFTEPFVATWLLVRDKIAV